MKKEHESEKRKKNRIVQACFLKKKSKHQRSWKHILYHLHHLKIYECPASSSPNSSPRPQKIRTLSELYEVTENENNVTLFCLVSDCEPVGFEEAVQDRR